MGSVCFDIGGRVDVLPVHMGKAMEAQAIKPVRGTGHGYTEVVCRYTSARARADTALCSLLSLPLSLC